MTGGRGTSTRLPKFRNRVAKVDNHQAERVWNVLNAASASRWRGVHKQFIITSFGETRNHITMLMRMVMVMVMMLIMMMKNLTKTMRGNLAIYLPIYAHLYPF